MCILDFITNGNSSKSVSNKYQPKAKLKRIIYFNDNISMVEKGKFMGSLMVKNKFFLNKLDRKKEWDAKTATCEFSSDDRERSSTEGESECLSSTCTLCTSSFSFCDGNRNTYM